MGCVSSNKINGGLEAKRLLMMAIDRGNDDDVRDIARQYPSAADGEAVEHSIRCGRCKVTRELINARAPVSEVGYYLALAAYLGCNDIISLLVCNGALLERVDDQGMDSICYASLAGHVHTVRLILSLGYDGPHVPKSIQMADARGHPDVSTMLRSWERLIRPVDVPLLCIVEQAMNAHQVAFEVLEVRRVDNERLRRLYRVSRETLCLGSPPTVGVLCDHIELIAKLGGIDHGVNEHLLYHGTRNVSAVQSRGLDERVSQDGIFGHGVYFSDNPVKSHAYTGSGDTRYMFLCRVTLGNACRAYCAQNGIRRAPCISTGCVDALCSHERYNSLVYRRRNHSEYVIYDGQCQAYPEVLIKYRVRP